MTPPKAAFSRPICFRPHAASPRRQADGTSGGRVCRQEGVAPHPPPFAFGPSHRTIPIMLAAKGDLLAEPRVRLPADRVAEFCRRHHVRRLSLFGSVLRDDFRPDSDVDVLVEFEPGRVVGLRIAQMEQELTEMLDGHTVDLRTPNELSHYFRDEVLREPWTLYGNA